jgi:hypothetical protein
MDANQENAAQEQPVIPEMEQEAIDTRAERDDQDFRFEQDLGLPIPQDGAPQPPQPGSNAVLGNEQPAQPAAPAPNFSQNEVAPNQDNDQVRYEYWQSQAAQMKNQLDAVKEYMPMVDYLRTNPEAVQNITPGGQPPADAPKSQEPEEFPPPPEKPEQPRGFSREEAMGDPSSESAIYLDTVEKWRDDMQTYNQLASQYEIAKMRENYDEKVSALEKQEQVRNAKAAEIEEMGRIRSYVGQRYNLGDKLDDFINTMNDPKSINMDDLVGYYQYKNGVGQQQAPPVQQPPKQASNNFRQTQRAQSVPRPMGVQPAQNPQTASSDNDFMSSIIKDNNNKSFL